MHTHQSIKELSMAGSFITIVTPGRTTTLSVGDDSDPEVLVERVIASVMDITGAIGMTMMLHAIDDPDTIERLVEAARRGNHAAVLELADALHRTTNKDVSGSGASLPHPSPRETSFTRNYGE